LKVGDDRHRASPAQLLGAGATAGDADHEIHAGGARRPELVRVYADDNRSIGLDAEILQRPAQAVGGRGFGQLTSYGGRRWGYGPRGRTSLASYRSMLI
jgi:hypothetical protein